MKLPIYPSIDDVLQVDLRMSTHLAIVVNLRVNFEDGADYVGLVIPRSQCAGDKPSQPALLAAAHDFLDRWASSKCGRTTLPREVSACINGSWTSLVARTHARLCHA